MNTTIAASLRRLLLLAGFAPALTAFAQPAEPDKLPDYVFTATRTPAALTTLGTYVDQISGAELARMQLTGLRSALGGVAAGRYVRSAKTAVASTIQALSRAPSMETAVTSSAVSDESSARG